MGFPFIFSVEHARYRLLVGNVVIAPEPDPATGTWPVVAVCQVINIGTKEIREQTAYLGDAPTNDVSHAHHAAIRGLMAMEKTIMNRLERATDTPTPQQVLVSPVRIKKALAE